MWGVNGDVFSCGGEDDALLVVGVCEAIKRCKNRRVVGNDHVGFLGDRFLQDRHGQVDAKHDAGNIGGALEVEPDLVP